VDKAGNKFWMRFYVTFDLKNSFGSNNPRHFTPILIVKSLRLISANILI